VGDPVPDRRLKRKVLRQVKRPYTKKVKVPIKTHKVVEVPEVKRIKVKKWSVEDGVEEVVEKQTIVVSETLLRDKEVWHKQEEMEEYDLNVPIVKKKKVKREFTEIEEKEMATDVNVQGARVLTFPAFRIDEIPCVNVIEREEFQTVEVYAHPIGPRIKGTEREVGRKEHRMRFVGTWVYPKHAKELDNLPEDPYPERHKPLTTIVIGPTTSKYSPDQFDGEQEGPKYDGTMINTPFIIREIDPQQQFLIIQNIDGVKRNLSGWRLHDQSVQNRTSTLNVFDFAEKAPNLVLNSGDCVNVYFGRGSSNARKYDGVRAIHWTDRDLFAEEDDAAYLIDEEGQIKHILRLKEGEEAEMQTTRGVSEPYFPPSKSIQYFYRRENE
jgi:hypothetical protein